jgi:integrase
LMNRIRFDHMAHVWEQTRADRARSTRDRDRSYLRSLILPVFGSQRVSAITQSQVHAWSANLMRAPSTRNKALQILRSVLELARSDGVIRTNPAAEVPMPPPTTLRTGRALNDDELTRLIDAAELVAPSTGAMVVVIARCGLRIGEAIALKVGDIDFDRHLLVLSSSMSRNEGLRPLKGRMASTDVRWVPMAQDVENRLRRHLTERSLANLSGFVFLSPAGGPIQYDNFRGRIWTKIKAAAGLDIRPHDLRHSAATRLYTVDRWASPHVQAFLGHRDPRVTQRIYAHVHPADLPRPSTLGEQPDHAVGSGAPH